MGMFVEEERQPFENQGPDLLSCSMSIDLLGCSIFLSNKFAKPPTAEGLVEA